MIMIINENDYDNDYDTIRSQWRRMTDMGQQDSFVALINNVVREIIQRILFQSSNIDC